MLQLIETICWENGEFQRLALHEARMNRSRIHFFGLTDQLSLANRLTMPEYLRNQKSKCRVTYSGTIDHIDYEPYTLRSVRSLKLVQDDNADYSYKLKNRDVLNRLFELRGESDDILIVKNGLLTDSSYANIVLLKDGKWYTPAIPLLPGTKREYYLQRKLIRTMSIRPTDLWQFEEARLINALLSLEDGNSIPISNIRP